MITAVDIAEACHEINRIWCRSMGDDSQPRWEDAPPWQRESAIAGVELHLANPDTTPEESHDSWMEQKRMDGWVYGPMKDVDRKEHPCMLPYRDLPMEQQIKDSLFATTVMMFRLCSEEMDQ